MKVLHVIPSLEYSGAAMQLLLLAQHLPQAGIEARVCVLGKEGPCAPPLRAAGVPVEILGWSRCFDPGPPWQLRRRVRHFGPDVIHTWGPAALRAVTLVAGRTECRVLVSKPLSPGRPLTRLDRWLLRRVDRIAATGPAEAGRCRALGCGDRVAVVPPAAAEERPWLADATGPAVPARFVLCAGPLEPHKGFYDAIWGFDILRYVYPDLCLLLLGSGSDRPRLERFVRSAGAARYVHFAGDRADVPALLKQAELVWVPSRADAGITFALESMAAGRPVIASRLPGLAEVVADGVTGVLVPPGDKVAMARQTHRLLGDAPRRQAMGAAGKARVHGTFGAADLARRVTALYDDLAA